MKARTMGIHAFAVSEDQNFIEVFVPIDRVNFHLIHRLSPGTIIPIIVIGGGANTGDIYLQDILVLETPGTID